MVQRSPPDLTEAAWTLLAPLIPAAKVSSRPRTTDMREVVNAIFYVLRGGCQWLWSAILLRCSCFEPTDTSSPVTMCLEEHQSSWPTALLGARRQSPCGCGSRGYADPRGPWGQSSSRHNASAGDAAGADVPSPSRRPHQTPRCGTERASAACPASVGARGGFGWGRLQGKLIPPAKHFDDHYGRERDLGPQYPQEIQA
jgi:Putative transposase of IS4/5 family (DUF4096)